MEEKGIYLIGQDITGCKCGKGDHSVTSYFVKTTRYIQKDYNGDLDLVWECEQCGDARCFEYSLPEDSDFNFCPKCGRKIVEFVKLPEVEEEE